MTFNSKFEIKKNVVSAVFGFVLNMALVFFGYKLLIAQGGVASLGVWSTLTAWVYLIRIGDVGMGGAITRFVAMKDAEKESAAIRGYLDTGIVFNALLFFVLSGIGYFALKINLKNIIQEQFLTQAESVLPILMSGYFLTNISGLVVGGLQGLHKGFLAARLSVLGSLIQMIVVLYLVPKFGLLGLGWGIISQQVVLIVLGWILIVSNINSSAWFPVNYSWFVCREMIGYSVRFQLVNFMNGIFEPLSKIIISYYGGTEVQGLYELAYKTVSLPRNAIMSGAQATLPATAGLLNFNILEAEILYKKVFKKVMFYSSVVMLGVILLCPLSSILWLKNVNTTYWLFVLFLAIGFLGNSFGAPAYNLGLAAGISRNNLISAVLVVVTVAVFGLALGAVGGFLGSGVAIGLSLLIGGIFIKRKNEMKIFGKIL